MIPRDLCNLSDLLIPRSRCGAQNHRYNCNRRDQISPHRCGDLTQRLRCGGCTRRQSCYESGSRESGCENYRSESHASEIRVTTHLPNELVP